MSLHTFQVCLQEMPKDWERDPIVYDLNEQWSE
jgi:hypothetical protein